MMKAWLPALCAAALLAACAGARAPEWQAAAHGALERFKQHYLAGESRRAQHAFTEAKENIAATGRLDLAARADLIHCAVATAALDYGACAAFEQVKGDASPGDLAYFAFLAGDWQGLDAGDLPAQYRRIVSGSDAAAMDRAVLQIEDPLSRLIAAGVLFRKGGLSARGMATAVDTASAHGYRRPLLAYLNIQATLAEEAGDTAALGTIRRRIELILN
ncbi:MAG: hypothetical protein WDZ63_08220 [Burkholderiales bacterium]